MTHGDVKTMILTCATFDRTQFESNDGNFNIKVKNN